jgi:RND family efflux transporter MFP subunit
MSRRHRRLLSCYLISLATAGCLYLSGCSDSRQHQPAEPAIVSGLGLTTIKLVDLPESMELVGTVKARTSALVSARISGTVSLLQATEGDRVSKGQLLGKLDSRENLAQASGARAAIDEAGRGLEEAQARLKLAESTFQRFSQLYDEQALTRHEYDTRHTELELAQKSLARAEARLQQTRDAAAAATTLADYTNIVAPISGVIVSKQGGLGSTVFPGQPLFMIDEESSYQLELAVPESLLRLIHTGTRVQVQVDAVDDGFQGEIKEIVPASDPASRTYTAKIPLPV